MRAFHLSSRVYWTGNFGKIFYSGGNSDRFLCSGSRDFAGNLCLLPFLVSSCSETMLKVKEEYLPCAEAMGISRWYAIATIVLPASWKNIMMSMILAIGRAMGETMAVMMVIGNANLFPHLLGKSESIASVIALEMGTAVVGSTHYHALYAAGMVLMILLFAINMIITILREKLIG